MAKKILVIYGHPNKESLNHQLAKKYVAGAQKAGHEVIELILADLQFTTNLSHGYQKRTELEPDLVDAQQKIIWAEHLVFVHPVWWGSVPALLKGFIDRTFLPGFAFKYRENSVWWDKLLKGRTARILTTLDQPAWYYRWVYGRPSVNQLKKSTLEFCGIKPIKVNYFGIVKDAPEKNIKKWLEQAYQIGNNE